MNFDDGYILRKKRWDKIFQLWLIFLAIMFIGILIFLPYSRTSLGIFTVIFAITGIPLILLIPEPKPDKT